MVAQLYLGGFELLFPLLFVALIFILILVLANRGPADPTGERPFSIYLLSVCFVALFLLLLSGTAFVGAAVDWALNESGGIPVGPSYLGGGDVCTAAPDGSVECSSGGGFSSGFSIQGLAVTAQAAVGVVVFTLLHGFHWRRAREIVDAPGIVAAPARGPYEVYLYATCFTAVLALTSGGLLAGRALAAALPGAGDLESGFRGLLTYGVLAYGGFLIARAHWRRAEALRRARPPSAEAEPAPPPPPAPPARPRKPAARKPAARKRTPAGPT